MRWEECVVWEEGGWGPRGKRCGAFQKDRFLWNFPGVVSGNKSPEIYLQPAGNSRLGQAVRDGDDDALPNAATACEAQAMEEHAAEDIKHFRPTTVRLPAARSLPLGLADGGHAVLRGR